MEKTMVKDSVKWANPDALGLAGFGFNTILLQIHNIGLIDGTLPLIYGFFWGGIAQIIAGIIDGRRGNTFGFTAFTSFGLFWTGLSFGFLLEWMGFVELDGPGLAWLCICWGIFTGYMTIGTFKISRVHVFIFTSLTLLFFLLAAHFYGALPAIVPGIEGIFCGTAAAYGSAAAVLNASFGRELLPMGLFIRA
ncbi:Succinate-acetate/proton symporter SatP [subsurface metagenome]